MNAADQSAGEPNSSAFYRSALERLQHDERYQRNLDWGEPRHGHPEGTLRAHLADLEANATRLRHLLPEHDWWRLRLLIHSHDTFKPDAAEGAKIRDSRSHASLARSFLAEFCPRDEDLLNMAQFHDEPYALWRQERHGVLNQTRLDALFATIKDWGLFLSFLIVDGCTEGKGREPLHWFFRQVAERGVESNVTANEIS